MRVTARPSTGGAASGGGQVRVTLPAPSMTTGRTGTPRLLRRGPTTGLAFVPTVDTRFRRTERIRVELSLSVDMPTASARLLDRKGQPLAVPVISTVREDAGGRAAVAEAMLASLAPGDYLVELTLGDGGSRQVVMMAIRIVP